MRVKTAELKNSLSRYLHRVRDTGETIIVCDRDLPIAIIGPLPPEHKIDRHWKKECDEMQRQFGTVGLTCRFPAQRSKGLPKIKVGIAPDKRKDVETVAEMRRSRDW